MTTYPQNRFVMPWSYAPSITGAPAQGDKLYFYASGTSTPQAVYSDDNLSIEQTNPLVADSNGIFRGDNGAASSDIFLQNLPYKVVWTDADGNERGTADPVSPFVDTEASANNTCALLWCVDGNGGVPEAGKTGDLYVPFPCDITAVVLQADQAGDLVVDIDAAPFVTNTPPAATDSIVASAPPTLGSSQSSIDETLTGWTTHLDAGTALRFSITSISEITRFTLTLVVDRST